jgi:hypothetical protein
MLGLPLRLTAGAFDKLTAHKLSSAHLRIEVMLNVGELEGNASSGLGMGSSKLEIFGICNPSVCRGGGCGLAAEQREMLDLLSIANAPFFPQRGIRAGATARGREKSARLQRIERREIMTTVGRSSAVSHRSPRDGGEVFVAGSVHIAGRPIRPDRAANTAHHGRMTSSKMSFLEAN